MSAICPNENIFLGRKSGRSDGKEKRILLLEAALRVIVRDGIRGVKHRAIAKEAAASLSSTTYYFKNIDDLISDAFVFYAQKEIKYSLLLKRTSLDTLKDQQDLTNIKNNKKLAEIVSTMLLKHIEQQVKDIDSRKLEYAFQAEAIYNKKLADILIETHASTLSLIEQVFIYLGSKDPVVHAHVTFACIRDIEYKICVDKTISFEDPSIIKTVRHMIQGLFSSLVD